jgi:hypothetical protein
VVTTPTTRNGWFQMVTSRPTGSSAPNSFSAAKLPSTITCSFRDCSRSLKKRPRENTQARLMTGNC